MKGGFVFADGGTLQGLARLLLSSSSLLEAPNTYKRTLVQDLATALRRRNELNFLVDQKDDDLFCEFLPQSRSSAAERERPTESLKRVASEVLDTGKITRKSKIPALAWLT